MVSNIIEYNRETTVPLINRLLYWIDEYTLIKQSNTVIEQSSILLEQSNNYAVGSVLSTSKIEIL